LSQKPIVTIFVTIERHCHRFLNRKQGTTATFRKHSPCGGGHSLKYTVEMAGRAESQRVGRDWRS